MSRSGYIDDFDDQWSLICWRGAVKSAIRGKRGQSFLRELRDALDAMPIKKLISDDLVRDGEVCAIGAVAVKRNVDVGDIDPCEVDAVARVFDIAPALAREIVYENDEVGVWGRETPERRWKRMRKWVNDQIIKDDDEASPHE